MTPGQCLEARFRALSQRDYKTLYKSYHAESPFLQQFKSCKEYLAFAEQQLNSITIECWRCIDQRQLADDQVECLLVMEMTMGSDFQYFYESALLIQVNGTWFYHSAQKLGAEDYTGFPDQVRFDHFDRATEKIRF